jgi:Trp operon repressor
MLQTFETEVLGFLTKKQFEKFIDILNARIGKARRTKRLSIQITDYAKQDLDTRIRITNGEAEIMQKVGDWNAKTREEISVMLPTIPDIIFQHWQILNHIGFNCV